MGTLAAGGGAAWPAPLARQRTGAGRCPPCRYPAPRRSAHLAVTHRESRAASGRSFTAEWSHSHTLDVSADDAHVKSGGLLKIETITISGFMRWQRAREHPDFKVMRRVRDGKPFAGAFIALGDRDGHMFALVISDDRTMDVHIVQLEDRHLNMIRQLSLLPGQSEASES